MKRYDFDIHADYSESVDGGWIRYSDHVEAMKRIAGDGAQQEPVAWRHSHTLCLYETREDVPLADGDEWAEPLYLAAPAPSASPAALTADSIWQKMDDYAQRRTSPENIADVLNVLAASPAALTDAQIDGYWESTLRTDRLAHQKFARAILNAGAVQVRTDAFRDCIDAIKGAIAFGQRDRNPAPDGHWLAEFWEIGRRLAASPASTASREAWAVDLIQAAIDLMTADQIGQWTGVRAFLESSDAEPSASPAALTDHEAESLRMIAGWFDRDGTPEPAAFLRGLAVRLAASPADQMEGARDAARYRWLRSQHEAGETDLDNYDVSEKFCVFRPGKQFHLVPVGCFPGELDSAIDAAMSASKEGDNG